jgi:hypothetical protein
MREAPSTYIFESDGTVHRQRYLEGDEEGVKAGDVASGVVDVTTLP